MTDRLTTGESPGLADGMDGFSAEEEEFEGAEGGTVVEFVAAG